MQVIKKEFGHFIDDFFAESDDLLKPEMQISEIVGINDFELQRINETLKAWMPANTQKVMISFIVQVGDHK